MYNFSRKSNDKEQKNQNTYCEIEFLNVIVYHLIANVEERLTNAEMPHRRKQPKYHGDENFNFFLESMQKNVIA